MPMFMDSPGFQVATKDDYIGIVIPAHHMNHKPDFKYDLVAAYMAVNTEKTGLSMLGGYTVYSVVSGNLLLRYEVRKQGFIDSGDYYNDIAAEKAC